MQLSPDSMHCHLSMPAIIIPTTLNLICFCSVYLQEIHVEDYMHNVKQMCIAGAVQARVVA